MKIIRIPSEGYGSNCWLLYGDDGQYVIIDPSSDIDTIKDYISSRGLTIDNLKYILITHGHFDHLFGLRDIKEYSGAPVAIHELDDECLTDSNKNLFNYFFRENITYDSADIKLKDKDIINVGSFNLKVIHTPGHTKGSVCFITDDSIFSGDTLFDLSVGRTDLYGASPIDQIKSLKLLKGLNSNLKLYPGHGSISTMEKQLKYNQYLQDI